MGYKLTDYFAEIADYQLGNRSYLSKSFIALFAKRRGKGWDLCEEEEMEGDDIDYHAWGYALYDDIDSNGEDLFRELNISEWEEFYETGGKIPNPDQTIKVYRNGTEYKRKAQYSPSFDNEDEEAVFVTVYPSKGARLIAAEIYYWSPTDKKWVFND